MTLTALTIGRCYAISWECEMVDFLAYTFIGVLFVILGFVTLAILMILYRTFF